MPQATKPVVDPVTKAPGANVAVMPVDVARAVEVTETVQTMTNPMADMLVDVEIGKAMMPAAPASCLGSANCGDD